MIPNWKKHVSLSEKSNDMKKKKKTREKQEQQQRQPLRTKNIITANVKSKSRKIDFKNGWNLRMKSLMTPLFCYGGNLLDVSERLGRNDSAPFMMATKTIL